MDAANMLKPALARGDLRAIGATTLDEYRKHIEKDAALARRFQPVLVDQPTVEATIAILRGLKERYEVHHGIRIRDAALIARSDAEQPLHHRALPAGQGDRPGGRGGQQDQDGDRQHAVPDRPAGTPPDAAAHRGTGAQARARRRLQGAPRRALARGGRALRAAGWRCGPSGCARRRSSRASARSRRSSRSCARARSRRAGRATSARPPRSCTAASRRWRRRSPRRAPSLRACRARRAATSRKRSPRKTSPPSSPSGRGSPSRKMLESEMQKLLRMEDELRKRVVGQDDALVAVANAVRRSRAGLWRRTAPDRLLHLPRADGRRQDGDWRGRSRTSCSTTSGR